MADLFGAIGDVASPIKPALDWLAPPAQPTGEGFSLGQLLKSVGQGAMDVVGQGPGAISAMGSEALDLGNGLSTRDRILFGGMAALGSGMLARQAHLAWKRSLSAEAVRAIPAGYNALLEMGEPRRYAENLTPLGALASQRYPGINLRQAEMLGAVQYGGVVRGIRNWAEGDVANEMQAHVLFENYANRVGSAEAAQVDWARFHQAMETDVFGGPNNVKLRKLWGKLTTEPTSLTPAETEEIFGTIESTMAATQAAGHDMTVGIVGRIDRIEMTPQGPVVFTRHPVGWTDGSSIDPRVREARLRDLNYRNLAERGKFMLKTLYQRGMEDWDRPEGAARRLPKDLEVGPEWYPRARSDVAKAFGLPDEDSDALQRAVAAVSFLSEAEDWSTNIPKAKRVMQATDVHGPALDPDFQAWLRQGSAYAGSRGAEYQRVFNDIHKHFTSNGFKVSKADLGVILRLIGEQESVVDIFATTKRRKQKNFFLNIYDPSLPYPVTIDRHAFDAFLGIDSGIQDRPIDLSMRDGDTVYDVVADTYRSLAGELGITPHELQAVVWETWRMLKFESGRNGWARNDPFMLPEQDGSTNAVYEALNGRDIMATPGRLAGRPVTMPANVLRVNPDGIAQAVMPDGTVAPIAEISEESAARLLGYYPAVLNSSGVPVWRPTRPHAVKSIEEVRSSMAPHMGATGEASLSGVPHPVQDGSDTVTAYLEDNQSLPKLRGLKVEDLGRVEIDEPEFRMERLGPEDLTPAVFRDPTNSPLKTHAWAAISAERPGIDTYTASNALRAELQRRGFKPIDMDGIYEGGSEHSFLVFGITPEEALHLGEMFDQDSIATNAGLIFNRRRGSLEPANFDPSGDWPAARYYGAGDLEAVFNGAPKTTAPWRKPPRLKNEPLYDQEMVNEAIKGPKTVTQVDPRYLYATQSEVTWEGAHRYMTDPEAKPLAKDGIGNEHVYVYERRNGDRLLLTGHHRALRALLKGEPLEAILVREGGHPANAGVLPAKGLSYDIPDDADFRSKLNVGGEEVTWAVDDFGDMDSYNPSEPMRRVTRVRRKVQVKFGERSQAGIVETAEELEQKGARGVSIYSRRPDVRFNQFGADVGEAWQRAVDHVYSDGVQTYVVRTTGDHITAPNSGYVFTRSLDGLPAEPPRVSSRWGSSFEELTAQFPEVEVTRGKSKTTLKASEDDVGSALELKANLEQAGIEGPFELRAGDERYSFPNEPKIKRKNTVRLMNGSFAPSPRRDTGAGDLYGFERDFGFEFDPAYRVGNEVHRLPDTVVRDLRQITEVMYDQYGEAFRRWRLPRITVNPGFPGQYAHIEDRAGGLIVLSKEWWQDPDFLQAQLTLDRQEGWLARNASNNLSSILAHEYGHMIHNVVIASQGWAKNPDINKRLRKLVSPANVQQWHGIAEQRISTTAGTNPYELAAEAFSEVFTGKTPSRLSQQVVALINEELEKGLKYRKVVGL